MKRLLICVLSLAVLISFAVIPAMAAEKKVVKIVRCGWLEAEIPLDRMIAVYNTLPEREIDGVQIVLDPAGKSESDPLLKKFREDKIMVWNGALCSPAFIVMEPAIMLENIVPIEQYFETTQYKEAAARIKSDMFRSVWNESSYKGKLYYIPMVVDVVTFMYRADYLAAVGYANAPTNWDQVLDAAKKVQVRFAKDKIFGFGPTPAVLWRYLAAMHQAFAPAENLFTSEGLLNITDAGWIKAMETTKQFIDAKVVPAGWETWGYPESWKQGKLAMALNQHSMGTWGGMIWGYEKLKVVPTPPGPGITKIGTMFWSSSFTLYNDAPYPQETMDFIIWLADPNNADWQASLFKAGKISAMKSAYEKYISKDDVTQNWAFGVAALLEGATAAPNNRWYIATHSAVTPLFVKYLLGQIGAVDAMAQAKADLEAQMKK